MTISVKTYSNGEVFTAEDLNIHLATMVDEINRLSSLHIENQKTRNLIINGDFSVWQRGTSQTATGYGSDDRWVNELAGSTQVATQQTFTLGQTDVTNNPKYYARTVVTSVAGAGNYARKAQRIEGVEKTSGSTVTVSFWAKADSSKNIAVELIQNFGTGGSPSSDVTAIGVTNVALTTAWALQTITIAVPTIAGKALGTGGNDYLEVAFWMDAGSTFNARTNTLGQQSGTFEFSNVQLEIAVAATDFEYINEVDQLARCKRYFERINYDTSGSTVTMAQVETETAAYTGLYYTEKISTPTVAQGGTGTIRGNTAPGGDAGGTVTFGNINKSSCKLNLTGAAGLVAGNASRLSATAAMYIDIDAEL